MPQITIDQDTGIVRVDDAPVCRRMKRGKRVILQFQDAKNCKRTERRGTRQAEVSLTEFIEFLDKRVNS